MQRSVSSKVLQPGPTATVENYLALLYVFERDSQPAIATRLAELLEVPWSRLHAMEHAISDNTVARLQERFDHPRTCPHGNPFPGKEKVVAHWVKLTELSPGRSSVIRRIHELAEDSSDLLLFLEQNSLMPGARFTVRDVMPFNETMMVDAGDRPIVLGLSTAQWLYAEPVSPAKAQRH